MIKIGDKVTLNDKGVEKWEDYCQNPRDTSTVGTIISGTSSWFKVDWGPYGNLYQPEDLKLYEAETKEVETTEGKQMFLPHTVSQGSIVVVIDGNVETVTSDNPAFEQVKEELQKPSHDGEAILKLINRKAAVIAFGEGKVTIQGNTVLYDGHEIHNSLTDKMIGLMDQGFNIKPWVAFMENLEQNPSYNSRQSLFDFLEKFQAPFTEDGCFIAFKRVKPDFKDIYTGTMDNSPGTVVKIDRSKVDDNINNTCSAGLHVAASSYLDSYASTSRAKTIMCKVNPRDVVAVPKDYGSAKMRVCEYEVLEDITVEQMSTYEKQAYVSFDEPEVDDCEWEVGDWIEYDDESTHWLTKGNEYEIVDVDQSDYTVKVMDNQGEFEWMTFTGKQA